MILSSSSLSTHSTLTQAFLTFKTFFNTSLPGCLLIFLLLTPLRLNSCSSDSKTNLPNYTTLHLTPPGLLEISTSSLTNILLSLTKLHLSPKPVTTTFNFALSGLTLIHQLPVPLLPLLSTPNLITVIISTINSLSLNYPVSSRSRTLLPKLRVLSLKLPSPVISLPSYTLSTGSKSLNASNTSSSNLPTKSSQLANLQTFITSSPFNVLASLTISSTFERTLIYRIVSYRMMSDHTHCRRYMPFIMLSILLSINSNVSKVLASASRRKYCPRLRLRPRNFSSTLTF